MLFVWPTFKYYNGDDQIVNKFNIDRYLLVTIFFTVELKIKRLRLS